MAHVGQSARPAVSHAPVEHQPMGVSVPAVADELAPAGRGEVFAWYGDRVPE